MISGKQLVCMQRQGRRELLPFDPEPERTLINYTEKHTQPNMKSCRIKKRKGSSMIGMNHKWNIMDRNYRNKATRSFV